MSKNGRGGQGKREHKRLEEGGIQTGGGRHPDRGRPEGLSVANVGYTHSIMTDYMAYWYSVRHQVYPSCSRMK